MKLLKPFKYTAELRNLIQKELPFKFIINQKIRDYAKGPKGEILDFKDLKDFIIQNYKIKRLVIPPNQLYLKHVKKYWADNLNGTHKECVDLWNLKPFSEKKLPVKTKFSNNFNGPL